MAEIIVAGAGHGGLAAAAQLSKAGHKVTVYERAAEGTLGYDWTDIFAPRALTVAHLGMPAEDKYEYKENMTFFAPNCKTPVRQDVPENELEIKMERRDIYAHLIDNALKCGVKIVYGCEVEAPVMAGNRVVGIKTSLGTFSGDLIIDAAGKDSPVRSKLPRICGIQNEPAHGESFYVYRAFYNRMGSDDVKDKYRVYLFPGGEKGISWVATEGEYVDVLIGRFDPITPQVLEKALADLKVNNPQLGDTVLRGGQFVQIPVRRPLSVMVCDGYAAIGDSAYMTVPIIGSGIANSLKASRILAETVAADRGCAFCAETLWSYQVKYYKQLGAGYAAMEPVKRLLMGLSVSELNYLFDNGILTSNEMTIGAESTSLGSIMKLNTSGVVSRARYICNDRTLLKKLLGAASQISRASVLCAAMPRKWNRRQIFEWAAKYEKLYK